MPALAYRTKMPSVDDVDIREAVAAATLNGHPIRTAGEMAGIGGTTAYDWYRQGEAILHANPQAVPAELGSLALFTAEVKRAEAEVVDAKLKQINAAAAEPKHWPAAMTLLERRFPADFGRNQRIEIEQNVTHTYRIELGTAFSAVLDMIVELESVDSPQLEHLLPESTKST